MQHLIEEKQETYSETDGQKEVVRVSERREKKKYEAGWGDDLSSQIECGGTGITSAACDFTKSSELLIVLPEILVQDIQHSVCPMNNHTANTSQEHIWNVSLCQVFVHSHTNQIVH